jgi:hypothetical protein
MRRSGSIYNNECGDGNVFKKLSYGKFDSSKYTLVVEKETTTHMTRYTYIYMIRYKIF